MKQHSLYFDRKNKIVDAKTDSEASKGVKVVRKSDLKIWNLLNFFLITYFFIFDQMNPEVSDNAEVNAEVSDNTIDSRWEPLQDHDDYEILNEFPFTIRRVRDKYVISERNRDSRRGYPSVCLNRRSYLKHVLIAKQFLPNDDPHKTIVDHINHDTSDYHLENLRWCTSSQNNFNRSSFGRVQYEHITDLPEDAIKVLFYDTRTEHHEFEDEKYYYYDAHGGSADAAERIEDPEAFQAEDGDVFYGKITDKLYRILHINSSKNGFKSVSLKDINNNRVNVCINRFRYQHSID